jgi:Cu(I)/Ag(I) efflux system membrane fusion protein
MNKTVLMATGAALVAAGLGIMGGYWLAASKGIETTKSAPNAEHMSAPMAPTQTERKPAFYRHPMNPAITSPVPAKDEMGMDYVPVYEEAPKAEKTQPPAGGAEQPKGKILYYRHPMGLPDTSPVPKKDEMGMDYIPVYAEEAHRNEAQVLSISTEKIQRLGVKTAPVEFTEIGHPVRSVGSVEADERRRYDVTLRFDGFIEKLYVNATGQSVTRGQPLFTLYSPDLISAQHEYLDAKNGQAALGNGEPWLQSGMKSLTDSSLERLRNWGISASELEHLQRQGTVTQAVVVRSPASGIILEKSAVAGARAMTGETLFKIADLSQVWIMAEVYEQDIGLIQTGQSVRVTFDAYPGRTFKGKVGFIYPTLNPATRTAKVRIELANPDNLFKPMMYAQLEIATQTHRALAVPRSAVLESGRRALVLVDLGEGRFEPRPVKLGLRGEDQIEIVEGLSEQERVVTSANFLIDSESNLKAALGAFKPAGPETQGPAPAEPSPPPAGEQDHHHHGGR